MPVKPFDYLIIIPALGAVIVSFFFAYSGMNAQTSVILKGDSGEWVFPVDAAETVKVSGPLGETVVEISGGEARIISSPCINQICVTSGSVRSQGRWSACLPNRVILYISSSPEGGNNENNVDAVAW